LNCYMLALEVHVRMEHRLLASDLR
jgi:hypothetical protein